MTMFIRLGGVREHSDMQRETHRERERERESEREEGGGQSERGRNAPLQASHLTKTAEELINRKLDREGDSGFCNAKVGRYSFCYSCGQHAFRVCDICDVCVIRIISPLILYPALGSAEYALNLAACVCFP